MDCQPCEELKKQIAELQKKLALERECSIAFQQQAQKLGDTLEKLSKIFLPTVLILLLPACGPTCTNAWTMPTGAVCKVKQSNSNIILFNQCSDSREYVNPPTYEYTTQCKP